MFLGEDFQILLPSLAADVVFLPRNTPSGPEVPLMTAGSVVNPLAKLNAIGRHLIVYDLKEEHEGLYTVKNNENPNDIERITLIVRGRESGLSPIRSSVHCTGLVHSNHPENRPN